MAILYCLPSPHNRATIAAIETFYEHAEPEYCSPPTLTGDAASFAMPVDTSAATAADTFIDTGAIGSEAGRYTGAEEGNAPGADVSESAHPSQITPTPITRDQLFEGFRCWQAGEPVPSEATPVAELPNLSDEDLATLREITEPFGNIGPEIVTGSEDQLKLCGINGTQATIIRKAYEAFMEAVRQDAAASGMYEPHFEDLHTVSVGVYDAADQATGWHIDDTRVPTLRYVASFGDVGPTRFGIGTVQAGNAPDDSYSPLYAIQDVEQNGIFTIVSHPPAVLSRFLANQTVHNSPDGRGFRLFFSVDIVIPQPRDNWRR